MWIMNIVTIKKMLPPDKSMKFGIDLQLVMPIGVIRKIFEFLLLIHDIVEPVAKRHEMISRCLALLQLCFPMRFFLEGICPNRGQSFVE